LCSPGGVLRCNDCYGRHVSDAENACARPGLTSVVASGGSLPADKADLNACLRCLNKAEAARFHRYENALQAVCPFPLTKAIGSWVGNTCSTLSKDTLWETAAESRFFSDRFQSIAFLKTWIDASYYIVRDNDKV
jgi:hypothetical protein